jgi:uncharacterized protein (DUF983 family)
MRTLRRGLTVACPVCGKRKLFRRWFTMVDSCPRCCLTFERLPGHSLGSIAINTMMSFAVMAVVLVASLIEANPDFDRVRLLMINVPFAVVTPILLLPMSKTLWSALELIGRPLAEGEVLPEFAPADNRRKR